MATYSVSDGAYKQFYQMVAAEQNSENTSEKIIALFSTSHSPTLTIHMQTGKETSSTIFQVVEFSQNDYFRVQLHEQKHEQREGEWVYFYQPNLYSFIISLFTRNRPLA